MRDSMNWSIGKRRFWLNSRIASFWLARSCERVETCVCCQSSEISRLTVAPDFLFGPAKLKMRGS